MGFGSLHSHLLHHRHNFFRRHLVALSSAERTVLKLLFEWRRCQDDYVKQEGDEKEDDEEQPVQDSGNEFPLNSKTLLFDFFQTTNFFLASEVGHRLQGENHPSLKRILEK